MGQCQDWPKTPVDTFLAAGTCGESVYFANMQTLAWFSAAMISFWPMSRRAEVIAANSVCVVGSVAPDPIEMIE